MKLSKISAIAVAVLLAASPLFSQGNKGKVQLSLLTGTFAPQSNALEQPDGLGGLVTAKFASGLALGGRVTGWFSESVGLEGTIAFSGTSLEGQAYGEFGALNANLLYTSSKLVFGFGEKTRFQLGLGGGMVGFYYDSDSNIQNSTIFTYVASVSVLIPVNEKLMFRIDVDDHIYNMYWEIGDLETSEILQNDLIFGAGLSISLN